MEINIIYIHIHRNWNDEQGGHLNGKIMGHQIFCYGHFLLEFLLNLLYIIPFKTENLVINLQSYEPGDYKIQNKPHLLKLLQELYPRIVINYNTQSLSAVNNYQFLKSCELTEEMYRDRLSNINKILNDITGDIENDDYPQVLFVKRNNAKNCHNKYIKNHDQLDCLFKKYFTSYKVITPENMSFIEQIKYFSKCHILISVFGSGLSNAIFMKNNSIIISNYYSCHIILRALKYKNIKLLSYLRYREHFSQSCGGLTADCDFLEEKLKTLNVHNFGV